MAQIFFKGGGGHGLSGPMVNTPLMVLKEENAVPSSKQLNPVPQPLVVSVNTGIDSRFNKYFMDAELLATAIIHTKCKIAWIKNAEQRRIGLAFLENKIQQQQQLATNSDGSNSIDKAASASELEEDFFTFRSTDSTNANARSILSTYIGSNSSSFEELNGSLWPKNIFLELKPCQLAQHASVGFVLPGVF